MSVPNQYLPEASYQKLKALTELYQVVKELIIFFEENNPDKKADIQPINELRNAFDHLMRAISVWIGTKQKEIPDNYIMTHIDKAFGHVYRAGYDTVDFLSLTIRGSIVKLLDNYHIDAIKTVMPEYYSRIRPDVETITSELTKYRASKDVADSDASHLIQYACRVKDLVEYNKTIIQKLPSLTEANQKIKRNGRKELAVKILIPIVTAVLGWLLHCIYP